MKKGDKLTILHENSKTLEVMEDDRILVAETLLKPEAFGKIMRKYSPRIERYIYRIARSTSFEIDDLLQNIFIKVYRNLNNFDINLPFSSWIYRIAHNETIDYIRKLKIRPKTASSDEEEDFFVNIPDDKVNVAEESNGRMLKEQVLQVLLKMKEKYRAVLVLKYLEDKDYPEIMVPVAILVHRAKKEFKELAGSNNLTKKDI